MTGVVAIIVLGWFVVTTLNDSTLVGIEDVAPVTQTATSTATTTKKTTTATKKVSVPIANQPVSMSYQNALELYKDNKRIQLSGDAFCQVSPNNVMYKNGTSIMIDNRSSKTRTIKVGSTYTIEGYGFKIIKLSSATLPATLLMDCDQQQNVAKVLLQM